MHLILIVILTAIVFFLLGWVVARAHGARRRVKEMQELDLRQLKPSGPEQWRGKPEAGFDKLRAAPEKIEPVKIIVNARLVACAYREISYTQILELAGVNPRTKPNGDYVLSVTGEKEFPHRSVTYGVRRKPGSDSERSGMMHPGCKPVRVESGMVFNVADTSGA